MNRVQNLIQVCDASIQSTEGKTAADYARDTMTREDVSEEVRAGAFLCAKFISAHLRLKKK